MDEKERITIDCIKHAIEDTQATIRAYDTKAEILGVLLTLAVGITNFSLLPELTSYSKVALIASWLVALVAVGLLGLVLHPKTNQFKTIAFGTFSPSSTYYLHQVTALAQNTVSSLAERAANTNWVEELMYESMKLSLIRDRKHCWFVLAIKVTGVALFLIFAAILLGAYCV